MSKLNDYDAELAKLPYSPAYCGLLKKLKLSDSRLPDYVKQWEETGFDGTEIWNLDCTIIEFVYPRLQFLMEMREGDLTKLYTRQIRQILKGFEIYRQEGYSYWNRKKNNTIKVSLTLFADLFSSFWT